MIDLTTLPDPDAPDFGAQLGAWRRAIGLSQQAASDLLGVAIGSLQKWERGDRRPGRPGNRQREPTRGREVYDRLQALRRGE